MCKPIGDIGLAIGAIKTNLAEQISRRNPHAVAEVIEELIDVKIAAALEHNGLILDQREAKG